MHTRSQKLAQAAYPRVQKRFSGDERLTDSECKDYTSLAKKFPSLIHTCGLAQAVAFYEAKGKPKPGQPDKLHKKYLADLAAVLTALGYQQMVTIEALAQTVRTEPLIGYMRLSRDAINAASWLKRYVEAVAGEDE
ncbi:MAG: type III-B CRISPR module-associated protein Cmr5 [Gemmataceae bacterium]